MNESKLLEILTQVRDGSLPSDNALERLRTLPFAESAMCSRTRIA